MVRKFTLIFYYNYHLYLSGLIAVIFYVRENALFTQICFSNYKSRNYFSLPFGLSCTLYQYRKILVYCFSRLGVSFNYSCTSLFHDFMDSGKIKMVVGLSFRNVHWHSADPCRFFIPFSTTIFCSKTTQ